MQKIFYLSIIKEDNLKILKKIINLLNKIFKVDNY